MNNLKKRKDARYRLSLAGGRIREPRVVAVANITAHMLRHIYATTLYYAGVDLKQAAAWMGHADCKTMLELYTHLDKAGTGKALGKHMEYISNSNPCGQREVKEVSKDASSKPQT